MRTHTSHIQPRIRGWSFNKTVNKQLYDTINYVGGINKYSKSVGCLYDYMYMMGMKSENTSYEFDDDCRHLEI